MKKSNILFDDGIETIKIYSTRGRAVIAAAQVKRHGKSAVVGSIFNTTVTDRRRKDYGKAAYALHTRKV
jgi:hypothetical protein